MGLQPNWPYWVAQSWATGRLLVPVGQESHWHLVHCSHLITLMQFSSLTRPTWSTVCLDRLTHLHCQMCSILLSQQLTIFTQLFPATLVQSTLICSYQAWFYYLQPTSLSEQLPFPIPQSITNHTLCSSRCSHYLEHYVQLTEGIIANPTAISVYPPVHEVTLPCIMDSHPPDSDQLDSFTSSDITIINHHCQSGFLSLPTIDLDNAQLRAPTPFHWITTSLYHL